MSARAVIFFPLVGTLVGGFVATGDLVLQAFPTLVRSVLVVGLWLFITGGLHIDGWIDACDAMAPGLTADKALAAMRDPRAGAMGVGGAFVLLGTKWALIIVHTAFTIPFTVLILSVFFRQIPVELEEAAELDGCTRFQVFVRIVIPLAIPSVFATGLFAFMLSYSEFLYAMILSGDPDNRALSVVLASLARNTDVSWGLLNGGIFLTILPTLVLVIIIWWLIVERIIVRAARGG